MPGGARDLTVDAACPGGRKFKTEWRRVENLTLNGDGDGEFEHVVSVSLYVPSFSRKLEQGHLITLLSFMTGIRTAFFLATTEKKGKSSKALDFAWEVGWGGGGMFKF